MASNTDENVEVTTHKSVFDYPTVKNQEVGRLNVPLVENMGKNSGKIDANKVSSHGLTPELPNNTMSISTDGPSTRPKRLAKRSEKSIQNRIH